MSHHTWNYQDALRKAGYRVTPQRELIMDLICESAVRMTAPQLCEAVRQRVPAINPATVYRNLHFLLAQRLIRGHDRDGQTTYALAGPHAAHHHLMCRDCGAEIEIPERTTAAFYAQLEHEFGFAVESDHLMLKGRCPDCRRRSTDDST